MIRRFLAIVMLSIFAAGGSIFARMGSDEGRQSSVQEHTAWVARILEKIETIKPGMTRRDLLEVFTTEGGLSTGLQPRFITRECPYFKVDVEFEAVGRPNRDKDGRVTLIEDSRDIIIKVSRPYLQFSITD